MDVPAVLFDTLDPRQTVELFVPSTPSTPAQSSHLISLAGRRLYATPSAVAHDIIRSSDEEEDSPLHGRSEFWRGQSRVSQAPSQTRWWTFRRMKDRGKDRFKSLKEMGHASLSLLQGHFDRVPEIRVAANTASRQGRPPGFIGNPM